MKLVLSKKKCLSSVHTYLGGVNPHLCMAIKVRSPRGNYSNLPSTSPSLGLKGCSLFSREFKFGKDWAIARKSLTSLYDRRKFSCWTSIWKEVERKWKVSGVMENILFLGMVVDCWFKNSTTSFAALTVQHTRRVCEYTLSARVCEGLAAVGLLWEEGGLTSTVMETGSRMERAVSSSLERAQENSSNPSMEQLTVLPLLGRERSFSTRVPYRWGWNERRWK